jgi:ribitol 2-dehydrogenase
MTSHQALVGGIVTNQASNSDVSSMSGKCVLITGGSSGIGRSMARTLAFAGARVMVTGRSEERLASLVSELGPNHRFIVGDVTEYEGVAEQVQHTVDAFGRVDVVVANAGIYLAGDLWEGDPAGYAQLISTNVTGVVNMFHAAIPHMLKQDSGDLVVTSSISGHKPIFWEPVYSASKYAVQSLVHGVRRQLIESDIRVMSLAPGRTINELWGITDESEIDELIAQREGIRSEDVAEALLFMLTRPRHVTVRDLIMLPSNQDL